MPGDRLLLESRAGAGEGQRILRLSGPFKFSTLSPFQDALRAPSVPSLIIDLAEVPCIDSSGAGALVQAYVSCRRAGGRLVLVGVNERVGSSLRMTGLDRLFNIYASVGEAEAALT